MDKHSEYDQRLLETYYSSVDKLWKEKWLVLRHPRWEGDWGTWHGSFFPLNTLQIFSIINSTATESLCLNFYPGPFCHTQMIGMWAINRRLCPCSKPSLPYWFSRVGDGKLWQCGITGLCFCIAYLVKPNFNRWTLAINLVH